MYSKFSVKRIFHPMQWTLKQTQIGSRKAVLLLTQGGHCCVFNSSRIPLLFWPCQRDNGVQSSAFRWKPVGLKTNPPHIWVFKEIVLQGDSCDCCKYHGSCLSMFSPSTWFLISLFSQDRSTFNSVWYYYFIIILWCICNLTERCFSAQLNYPRYMFSYAVVYV